MSSDNGAGFLISGGIMLGQMNKTKPGLEIKDLHYISYQEAYKIQMETVQAVIQGHPNTILLCEHPLVVTLGRIATEENIRALPQEIEKRGGQIVRIDRGGEVTLHCPGQIVVYPIFNLNHYGRDLKDFLEKLEQVGIDLLHDFDILARRISGQRGIWVGDKKIISIGIGVKKWVSYHGLAINVNTDLSLFSLIRPCGLDVHMTSMSELSGKIIHMTDVKLKLIHYFAQYFQL